MSQAVHNNPGVPTKPPAVINHSRSKAEKAERTAAKKARRAERLEAKKAAEEASNGTSNGHDVLPISSAAGGGSDASVAPAALPSTDGDGAVSAPVLAEDLTNGNGVGPTVTVVSDDGATGHDDSSDDSTGGLQPEPDTVLADTVPVVVVDGSTGLGADSPPRVKLTKAEKWKAKTAAAAARRAEAEQAKQAAVVVHSTPDLVSSVNADYDSTAVAEDDEANPGEELVKHGSFKAMEAAEKEESNADSTDSPNVDSPDADNDSVGNMPGNAGDDSEQLPVGTDDNSGVAPPTPVSEPPVETPPVEEVAPEAPKPELVVDNNTTAEQNERIAGAKKFYGSAFTAARSSLLTDAYRFLTMAIRCEAEGREAAVKMALNTALKKEAEAFALGAVAKAA